MARFPESDSRRTERTLARIPVTLLLSSEGSTAERIASTTDVSAQGVRILTQAALTPGQDVEMLSHYRGVGVRPVRAHVVWVSVEPDGATQAGLEFAD